MRNTSALRGADVVLANLNKEIKKIEVRSLKSVTMAGLFVKQESQKNAPWRTGNLVNSAYIRPYRFFGKSVCEIGYTASYAPFVHENPRAGKTGGVSPSGHKYGGGRSSEIRWSRVGGWKFLEKALKRNTTKILLIIRTRVMVKGRKMRSPKSSFGAMRATSIKSGLSRRRGEI